MQVYSYLHCELNMNWIPVEYYQFLAKNLSPILTIHNNNYIILFFKERRNVD